MDGCAHRGVRVFVGWKWQRTAVEDAGVTESGIGQTVDGAAEPGDGRFIVR